MRTKIIAALLAGGSLVALAAPAFAQGAAAYPQTYNPADDGGAAYSSQYGGFYDQYTGSGPTGAQHERSSHSKLRVQAPSRD